VPASCKQGGAENGGHHQLTTDSLQRGPLLDHIWSLDLRRALKTSFDPGWGEGPETTLMATPRPKVVVYVPEKLRETQEGLSWPAETLALMHVDSTTSYECPKCGAAMEPIEIGVEGLPIEQLQLCPGCYLVTWSDRDGLHVRQGVPMKPGVDPRSQPRLLEGEPEEC
jgi:hypothetical protein